METKKQELDIGKPKSQYEREKLLKKQIEESKNKEKSDPVKDAQQQNHSWHNITETIIMNFRGKKMSFNDIVRYVYNICHVETYTTLPKVRDKEEKISNLIADIYIQRSKAQYANNKLENQRVKRLGVFVEAKDRRSMTAIEARLSAQDDEYKAIIELQHDCKATLDFWNDMYNICMRTTDRLKQISMTLMAEMKLEPSDSGGKGQKVCGSY